MCWVFLYVGDFELILNRSHLREIRDRSVLRLFESTEVSTPQVIPAGPGVPQPLPQSGASWDQDQVSLSLSWISASSLDDGYWVITAFCLFHQQNYFSEPEFDTEYQHQHVHKNKVSKTLFSMFFVCLLLLLLKSYDILPLDSIARMKNKRMITETKTKQDTKQNKTKIISETISKCIHLRHKIN